MSDKQMPYFCGHMTQEQVTDALKGTKYEGANTTVKDWEGNGYYTRPHPNKQLAKNDAVINAARTIVLWRETTRLQEQLRTQDERLLAISQKYGDYPRGKTLSPEHGLATAERLGEQLRVAREALKRAKSDFYELMHSYCDPDESDEVKRIVSALEQMDA